MKVSILGTGLRCIPTTLDYRQDLSKLKTFLLKSASRLFWGCGIQNKSPTVPYKEVMNSDNGVRRWVSNIHRYGFSYVDGCPVTPEATEKLLERIAFIRHTHYGGFWDFTSDLSLKDTAYTSIALGAHTDTTYFSDPAGLQMFHLLSHTHGEGGASLLVDGFRAAHILKEESPEAYQVLSDVRVPTHASGNEGISIQPYSSFPVLNHHPVTGELALIRWNNDDRATMDEWTSEQQVEEWYDAARRWAEILRRNSSEYWEQLRPGRPLSKWFVLLAITNRAEKARRQSSTIGGSYTEDRLSLEREGFVAVMVKQTIVD
ncbi:MAG: hypothetical protein M1819_003910 [Sarea resinae]|nr:MAG: hypothetical protein M1819_003910 [Sarea resinae]